jgi:hypothetical protein
MKRQRAIVTGILALTASALALFTGACGIIRGSGEIHLGRIKTEKADLRLSGSGNIKAANIKATDNHIEITGSGDIILDDCTAHMMDTVVSGSGRIHAAGK